MGKHVWLIVDYWPARERDARLLELDWVFVNWDRMRVNEDGDGRRKDEEGEEEEEEEGGIVFGFFQTGIGSLGRKNRTPYLDANRWLCWFLKEHGPE